MLFFSDLQNEGNKYTAKTFLFRRLFSTMLLIGIRTKMKRKYRIDAGSGLCSQNRKPKLRPTQPRFILWPRNGEARP